MPSHMRDPNAPKPEGEPTRQVPPTSQPTQQTPAPGATRQVPPMTPDATQQAPRPAGSRFATEDSPSSYANEPQQVELPERSGPRLWWAWVILAIIVVVGVIWIWFFVIPHPEGSYEDVQGVEQGEVAEEGEGTGEGGTTEGSGQVIGSQGPLTMANPSGLLWNGEVTDVPTPIEIHGVSDNGVTLAFLPDASLQQIACRIVSVQVDGQTYEAGAADSPLHIQITAGGQGERDITSDPTFDVGQNEEGPYGQRVLFTVDGLTEAQYNGMVVTVEETPAGGTPVTGTISLTSQQMSGQTQGEQTEQPQAEQTEQPTEGEQTV